MPHQVARPCRWWSFFTICTSISSWRTPPHTPSLPFPGRVCTQVLIGGGVLAYGLYNSMYNVEGGHRAIKFNRLVGIKEKIYPEVIER